MRPAEAVRNAAAAALHLAPPFRGKARGGAMIQGAVSRLFPRLAGIATTRMRDGSVMKLDTGVRHESWAFWTGEYERRSVEVLVNAIPQGGVVLDVGANVGLFTVPLAGAARTRRGHVYAFEPWPANYERLCENVWANGLDETVTCVRTALGREEGSLQLEAEGTGTGNAWRSTSAHSLAVPLRRLDDFAAEVGITGCSVVKIDVEGGEMEVLLGGEAFLTRHRPVIFVEVNTVHMQALGWEARDLVELAKGWRYEIRSGDGMTPRTLPPASRLLENVLLVPT